MNGKYLVCALAVLCESVSCGVPPKSTYERITGDPIPVDSHETVAWRAEGEPVRVVLLKVAAPPEAVVPIRESLVSDRWLRPDVREEIILAPQSDRGGNSEVPENTPRRSWRLGLTVQGQVDPWWPFEDLTIGSAMDATFIPDAACPSELKAILQSSPRRTSRRSSPHSAEKVLSLRFRTLGPGTTHSETMSASSPMRADSSWHRRRRGDCSCAEAAEQRS